MTLPPRRDDLDYTNPVIAEIRMHEIKVVVDECLCLGVVPLEEWCREYGELRKIKRLEGID